MSVAIAPSTRLATCSRRPTKSATRPALSTIYTGRACVWCGHAITAIDVVQTVCLAEMHDVCVEQFDTYTYGAGGAADEDESR